MVFVESPRMAAQNGEPMPVCQGEICPMENNGCRVSPVLHRNIALGLLLAGSLDSQANAAPRESVAGVPSRPGVTQGYYLIEPEGQPRAMAVMFVGGEGVVGIEPGKLPKITNNFLMRSRLQLAATGLMLAYPRYPL